MSTRDDPHPEFDFFIPLMRDFALKDVRDTMERPFFSLSKRKRIKPIEYTSPDGSFTMKVEGHQAYGMATIWDGDVILWIASMMIRAKQDSVNHIPRTIKTTPYDVLRAIKRGTSGADYAELKAALARLRTTSISTTALTSKYKKAAGYGWLDDWAIEEDPVTKAPRGMTVTLSNWVYDAIVNEGAVLTLHPDYFLLTGGLERALYRIVRKHAGRQAEGWTSRLELLREKTGSEASSKEFTRMIKKIVARDQMPEYALRLTTTKDGAAALHAVHREMEAEAAARSRLAELADLAQARQRRVKEDQRAAEVDALMEKRARRG